MAVLPPELLSAAYDLKLDMMDKFLDEEAIGLLTERVPGFGPEQYAEARRLAVALDGEAFKLAEAWHAAGGRMSWPTLELAALCPGFLPNDYAGAIHFNMAQALSPRIWYAKEYLHYLVLPTTNKIIRVAQYSFAGTECKGRGRALIVHSKARVAVMLEDCGDPSASGVRAGDLINYYGCPHPEAELRIVSTASLRDLR